MAIIDSYSESNKNADTPMLSGENEQRGQALWLPACTISSVKFYLTKQGSPPGNTVAKIYAATGTMGTNGIPTGSILATSDTIAASTFPASPTYNLIEYTFGTPLEIAAGDFALLVEYTGGDGSNKIRIGYDSNGGHAGNIFYTHTAGSGWAAQSAVDLIFYIYGTLAATGNPIIFGSNF